MSEYKIVTIAPIVKSTTKTSCFARDERKKATRSEGLAIGTS